MDRALKCINKNIFQKNEENVKQNVKQINENDQVQKFGFKPW